MKWITVFLLPVFFMQAQNKINWDTTRYHKYHANLIIGFFQSYRNFNNNFTPLHAGDTNAFGNNFNAESKLSSGIEINYDKFGFSIGLHSKPQKNTYGRTPSKTFNIGFNFGGNIWFLETSYRSFTGFYDANTAIYDSSYRQNHQYTNAPQFSNQLFKAKFFYFSNHNKYAFRSNYVCNYRQLKTSGTWILSGNFNDNRLRNDSSFFPVASRRFYGDQGQLNGLKVFGMSVNAGAAITLVVWRSMFFHLMFMAGPEQQWRTYQYENKQSKTLSYLSLSGDFRASFGFNWRKAYIIWTSVNDFVFYNNYVMNLQNRSLGGSFMFGWRFNAEAPAAYKEFQKTKIYSNL